MNESPLARLLERTELSAEETEGLVELLTVPSTPDSLRAAVLMALEARGSTARELAEFALALRRRARSFPLPRGCAPIDLCGTGGAPRATFNVSTVSAFVVAAAGTPVAKHGNRSARNPSGSSDLLAALGLPVLTSRDYPEESLRRSGLAFLHAPLFHPATRAVAPVRAALGIPTIFNRIGPLTNPLPLAGQMVGTPSRAAARLVAGALGRLGVPRRLVVTSVDGADEWSPKAATLAFRSAGTKVTHSTIDGPSHLDPEDRKGEWGPLAPTAAAEETERLLAGGPGARRGAVLLTSGAALWMAGASPTLARGVETARDALDGGGAESKLGELRKLAAERAWRDAE